MKKLLVLATVVSFAFFSCKDKGTDTTPDGGSKAPTTYTQKVLLEFTTCAGCPYCPDGEIFAQNLITKYGADVFYPVAMHNNYQGADMMVSAESKTFSDLYSGGNPTGMINRIGGKCATRSGWDGQTASVKGDDAKCGLSVDASSKNGFKYTIKVKVGVGAADLPAGKYYVVGYLVNKTLSGVGSGWDQANGFNGTSGHTFFGKGNPLKGYTHDNVFMKSLNTMNGTLIDVANTKAGSLSDYSFDVDLAGVDASNIDVMAFVYFKSVSAPYVENVQRVKLGENKSFD